jgi:molybdopterin molybdotransferase
MAQLSDDCFAHGGKLMRLDEALALLAKGLTKVVENEIVPADRCANRILALDAVSQIDVPGRDNSAVDGYAVYFDDLDREAETRLAIAGRAAAGHPFTRPLARQSALRVFTGALLPDGPDTVLMQEDCRVEGGAVVIRPGIKRGANRRLAGEDVAAGAIAIPAGKRLKAQDLAIAAAIGASQLTVANRLKVGLFSSGDELAEPGQELPDGAIYDSNRRMASVILSAWGAAVSDLGILKDSRQATRERLAEAAERFDLLVTSGGVSMGEEDHIRSAIEAHGRLAFWKLAIKPGRPVAIGEINSSKGASTPLIGLPGNPVAAFVTLTSIGREIVFSMMGAREPAPPRFRVVAGFSHRKKPDRREWIRVKLDQRTAEGLPIAIAFEREGAGILSSLTQTDGLAEIPEDRTEIAPGEGLDFVPYTLLF